MLVDTHAHLYLDRFRSDLPEVVARAHAAGVRCVVQPAIDVSSVEKALALCDTYPGFYAMTALHPSETREATEADFEAVQAFCEDPRVVAVGESGLDYYWDRSFDDRQQAYFRRHIRLAMAADLPLILHIRDKQGREDVHRDLVRILREERDASGTPERLRGIFHCFSGPAWMIEAAVDLGFLLGIGGVLTFKNGGLDVIAPDLPMDRVVLETDAPFLAPVPHRGKRNEPAYVRIVAERLAELTGLPFEEIARLTTENAERLFGIGQGALGHRK